MRRTAFRLVLLAIVAGLVLSPLIALGDEPPCRREGERVSCSGDGFTALTDRCTQAKADAKVCALRLDDAGKEVAAWRAQLEACQIALASVPPLEPPRSAVMPLVGYSLGVVGVAVGAMAFGLPFDAAPRALLGTLGLSAVLGGAVLVLP